MNTMLNTLKTPLRLGGAPVDRVIVSMVISLAALYWIDSRQAAESLRFMGASLVHIAPFFVPAIGPAAHAKASGADQWVARTFSGNAAASIAAGALAGALSPFCSCGVIPLIAAMMASGVPLAPVMAFCIASPIMDPEMFILTAAGISLDFAVAKTVAASAWA